MNRNSMNIARPIFEMHMESSHFQTQRGAMASYFVPQVWDPYSGAQYSRERNINRQTDYRHEVQRPFEMPRYKNQ